MDKSEIESLRLELKSIKAKRNKRIRFFTAVFLVLFIFSTSTYMFIFVRNTKTSFKKLYDEKEQYRKSTENKDNELVALKKDYENLKRISDSRGNEDMLRSVFGNSYYAPPASSNYTSPQPTIQSTNCMPNYTGGFWCTTY